MGVGQDLVALDHDPGAHAPAPAEADHRRPDLLDHRVDRRLDLL
jgi:hypothetical protein